MNKKQFLALGLACSMAFTPVTVFAANFSDINDVPWEGAKTYINQVADLGLMVGDYNDAGQLVFRSRDGVTYCETMQLAYAIMQKAKGVSVSSDVQSKWTSVMNGYKIPTWAQPAVAYGLENGIVTISDIPGFVDSKGNATVNATREDVAVIFGRAMKDYGTLETNPTLSFGDAASISSVAKPYVAMLNKLGIINGDTDGNFTPKYTINRAEMAVMVSKTYDVCKNGTSSSGNTNTGSTTQTQSMSGEVTDVMEYGSQVILTVKSGSTSKSFSCTSATPTLRDGLNASILQVKVGDSALVSYTGTNTAVSVVANSNSSSSSSSSSSSDKKESTITGVYYSLDSESIQIKDGSRTRTYYFEDEDSDNCDFYVDGDSVSYSSFRSDAEKGYKVRVELEGDTAVKVYMETIIYGEFVDIDDESIELEVGGSKETYDFKNNDRDDVDFYIDDDDSDYDEFEDEASKGDMVELKLNRSDEVEEANLVTNDDDDDEETVKGTFYSISSSKITIKRSGSSSSKSYDFDDDDSDNVAFYYDGKKRDYDYIDDHAERDDDVKLTLNSKDEVTRVDVTPADDEDEVEGEITGFTSSYIEVDDKKYRYANDDADRCKFYIDGDKEDYDDIKNDRSEYIGEDVRLVLDSDGDITEAHIGKDSSSSSSKSDEEGKLTAVGSGRITVDGSRYDVEDEDDCDISLEDGNNSRIRDWDDMEEAVEDDNKEFEVELTLNSKDEVTKIKGYITKAEGEVYDVDSSDETIEVEMESGRYTYELSSRCTVDMFDDYGDDFDGLVEAFDDGERMNVTLKLNDDGQVTSIDVE